MTQAEIRGRLDRIRSMASDDEIAHVAQDMFLVDVLRSIAEGRCQNPADCAMLALQVLDIKFERWQFISAS